ncbi:PAC2 family protein [Nesterenkonia sp. F]|uniref:PAC2 family protein n=1 Tax=Nesterenkonia sp. F TaxID=795955 RepID=UPI000255D043|nr:PAC2 family protein [Nesterenkonia sp. F]
MTDPLDLLHVHASDRSAGSDAGTAAAEAGHAVDVLEGDLVPGDAVADRESLSMLVTWSGHTDAGSLSDQLSGTLLSTLPHRRLASFAVDELYDYRSRRPQVTFSQGRFSDYEGPELSLYEVRDSLGRPFLMLTGDEPDFRWEQVSETVLELVDRLDVRLVVLVDALGLPVPHTRALGVTAHGTRDDLISGISTWSPNAQIEAGLSQVLEMRLAERGREVVGYTLHVPHYLAGGRYPQVAVAGLEYAGAAMELMLPTDDLRESARMVEQDISRQVEQNSEVQGMVDRLERSFDAQATSTPRSLLVKSDEEVPDAEELGEAVEAYLATRPADPAIDEARRREADGEPDGPAPETAPKPARMPAPMPVPTMRATRRVSAGPARCRCSSATRSSGTRSSAMRSSATSSSRRSRRTEPTTPMAPTPQTRATATIGSEAEGRPKGMGIPRIGATRVAER